MTPEQKIAAMTKAINEAIKVLGNKFGSSDRDTTRCIQTLRDALKDGPAPATAAPQTAPPA